MIHSAAPPLLSIACAMRQPAHAIHDDGPTSSFTAMSNPLAEYLSALEARDTSEKAHEEYVNACKSSAVMHTDVHRG